MAAPEAQMPFIKNLASSDRKLRTASLESLRTFLSSRTTLSRTEALKLWKGLYYAHWMTDRAVAQQRLAGDLAALYTALPASSRSRAPDGSSPPVAVVWFAAFWEILSLQWPHIDALRLDKFLFLVRCVFASQLVYYKTLPRDAAENFTREVLAAWCFEESGDPRAVPLGLRLHVLDLWVDELHGAGFLASDGNDSVQGGAELVSAIGELVQALQSCPTKAVRERAKESYEDGRLPWVTKDGDDEHEEDSGWDEEWGGIDD